MKEKLRQDFFRMLATQENREADNILEQKLRQIKNELSKENLFSPLENYLRKGNWKKADIETAWIFYLVMIQQDCKNWSELYSNFPCDIIKKINQLWVDYSQGRFGLSIQQSIWENLGGELKQTEIDSINNKNNIWEKFIEQVGWKQDENIETENWCKFYNSLVFSNQNSPKGSLPMICYARDSYIDWDQPENLGGSGWGYGWRNNRFLTTDYGVKESTGKEITYVCYIPCLWRQIELYKVLGRVDNDSAIPRLIETLNTKEYDIKKEVVKALGKIGSESAVSALIDTLKNKKLNLYLLEEILEVLDRLDISRNSDFLKGIIDKLLQIIENIIIIDFQNNCWRCLLDKIGTKPVISALIHVLNDEKSNYELRRKIVLTLGEIGNELAVFALIEALNHEKSDVPMVAVRMLSEIGNESAISALIDAWNNHKNLDVRKIVAKRLEKMGMLPK